MYTFNSTVPTSNQGNGKITETPAQYNLRAFGTEHPTEKQIRDRKRRLAQRECEASLQRTADSKAASRAAIAAKVAAKVAAKSAKRE